MDKNKYPKKAIQINRIRWLGFLHYETVPFLDGNPDQP